MEEYNLFKLYHRWLLKYRIDSLLETTIDVYVENASCAIPMRWDKKYGNFTESFNLDFNNLIKVQSLLNKKLKGGKSFKKFISNLIKQYKMPLNQILYGPPGTGKTYTTKKIAVEIIDGDYPEDRNELVSRYNELVVSGQIYFTTFHQSMCYEDFIEGIKPKMNEEEGDEISYEIQDGIFKRICKLGFTKELTNFDTAYDNFINEFLDREDEFLDLYTPRGSQFSLKVNRNNNLTLFTTKNRNQYGTLTKQRLSDFYLDLPVFNGWQGYASGFINYLEEHYNLSKEEKQPNQKYVLIIDEINRGNVSSILGELITLIEKDKRLGREESMEVILPYSKEKFSVPDNVYIIGTMNTADRSVEALDTALRRRFHFEEIKPLPSLLSGLEDCDINLVKLLDTINKRIELLIDKDHQIGHSYFLKVQNFEELKITFKDKIIPLLEEYFYDDLGKIGLILGDNFIKPKERNNILAQNFNYDTEFIEGRQIYEFINSEDWNEQTFKSIYSATLTENEQ